MHWTAVAPVPMMPTRLPARRVMGAPDGSPPVMPWSHRLVWKHSPANASIPGIPGSFGRCSGPVPMVTNRARRSSPRFVRTIHLAASPSHVSCSTSVESSAPR